MFEALCRRRLFIPRRARMHAMIYDPITHNLPSLVAESLSPTRLFNTSNQQTRIPSHNIKLVRYHTLSYVWGDATDTLPITVNGAGARITRNLHHFLEHLRNQSDRRGPYWADALCMNQKDNEEKNVQVAMMGDIYSNSSICIAWLGNEDDNTRIAIQVLRAIERKARKALDDAHRDDTSYRYPFGNVSKEDRFRWRLFNCPIFKSVMRDINIWSFEGDLFSTQG